MIENQHYSINSEGDITYIFLDRKEKGNALSIEMIRSLTKALSQIEQIESVRFVILGANGCYFSAGADLKWMSEAIKLTSEENIKECIELATLFETIYKSNKIYIARVEGPCLGGGVGLAAACDMVIATDGVDFSFSEVRLGLVPAIIAPYIIYRIGIQRAKLLVLTGETISADEACKIGLIDFLTNQANINNDILELVGKLREGGKVAQQTSKNLFRELGSSLFREELKEKTSSITAGARVNAEGSEGIRAFLKKRLPNWKR